MQKNDIMDIADIRLLVDAFYAKIREDKLLGPVFNHVIEDRWPEHLAKMVKFWDLVLFGGTGYSGKPFVPHANLPVGQEHFERWQILFNEAVDSHFTGERSEEAKWRASKMADLFLSKIEYIRKSPGKLIIR